jgi:DNA uptake protein ComE-like DNA-binding protein
MKSILQLIKTHFDVNRHNALSIIFGTSFFILLAAGIITFDHISHSNEAIFILKVYDHLEPSYSKIKKEKKAFIEKKINHTLFNPNTASLETLVSNGMSKYAANNLINFRNKGKVYKRKEDLLKIYGVSESDYLGLEPFIDLPSKEEDKDYSNFERIYESKEVVHQKEVSRKEFKSKVIESFDINAASLEELIQIRGIGEVFANRILKYRDGLGGFYSLKQVKSTYGLADSTFQELKKSIYIQIATSKLKINEIEIENWKSSILKSNQKRAVIAYRKQHGNFKSMEDLKPIKVLDDKNIDELSHYLDFSIPSE